MSVPKQNRVAVLSVLKTRFDSKVAPRYELQILKLSKNVSKNNGLPLPEVYENVAIEKIAHLFEALEKDESCSAHSQQDAEVKRVLADIKKGRVLWKSCFYEDMRREAERREADGLDSIHLEPSEYKCRDKKCGSSLTYIYQKQTRSADEALTNFVICSECGDKYHFG